MRKYLIALFFLASCLQAQNPNYLWAKSAGGGSSEIGRAVATDAFGNVYITGEYWSTVISFDGTQLNNTAPNTYKDIFLAKYDNQGNFIWARKAGGTKHDIANAVAVDGLGNVIITGSFASPFAVFGTFTLSNSGGQTAGTEDAFIAKYDPSGNVMWAVKAGGSNDEAGRSIAIGPNDEIVIAGYFFSGQISFGGNILTKVGGNDAFLAKYDASGNPIWSKSIGGVDYDSGSGVAVDASGNVFFSGQFQGSIVIGSNNLTSSGGYDTFLAKYDGSGILLWVKKAGGDGDDIGYVACDLLGNAVIAGFFNSAVLSFGNVGLNGVADNEIFVAKYDPNGLLLWAKMVNGNGKDVANAVATDKSNNILLTGKFDGSNLNFGNNVIASNASPGGLYIAKYDGQGNPLWAATTGAWSFSEAGYGICSDASDNVYVSGAFDSKTINFGSTTLTNLYTNNVTTDIFVTKMKGNLVTGIKEGGSGLFKLGIYPNPNTGSFVVKNEGRINEIIIRNLQGNVIYQKQPMTADLSIQIEKEGLYILTARFENHTQHFKLTVLK